MTSIPFTSIDICKLPEKIREKLAQLDLELTEGDITEKGYEKKRRQLIESFSKKSLKQDSNKKEERIKKQRRRTTRIETRYHSEIRQEAVHQALSKLHLNNKCLEEQNNEQNNFQHCLSFRQRINSRSRRRINETQTSGKYVFLNYKAT